MTELIAARLRHRVRTAGPDPLVTYYDLDTGERTELSAVTFANWVDKTANLLVDELLLEAGDPVHLAVAETTPGHWVSLVWAMACWQTGTVATLGPVGDAPTVVCGPDWEPYATEDAEVLACSLHPLGLGFGTALPAGVLDYTTEVRGQPDSYAGLPVAPSRPAWVDPGRRLDQADLVAGLAGPARRRLVRPGAPWAAVRASLVAPLVTGGSSVVVVGADADRLARVRVEERVDPEPAPAD